MEELEMKMERKSFQFQKFITFVKFKLNSLLGFTDKKQRSNGLQ